MRILIFILILNSFSSLTAQADECNKLGVWLWHIETTGFSHETLANNLAQLGVQRIYVKVADGRINPDRWTELLDTTLVDTYQAQGLEVWAWSYNYPENDSLQAEALYLAAQTGYEGFVIDVESEFDSQPLALFNLFFAFHQAKQRAINDGIAIDTFNTYCTTWGNPKLHNYSINVIDPYVDGYMPQTYVEVWSDQTHINGITNCIREVEAEYKELHATKPIHHICATQDGSMTADQLNEFITASGGETSLWRIPGGGTSVGIWQDWQGVDWDQAFCESVSEVDQVEIDDLNIYPNPSSGIIRFDTNSDRPISKVDLYSLSGHPLLTNHQPTLDLTGFQAGTYLVRITLGLKSYWSKVVKVD